MCTIFFFFPTDNKILKLPKLLSLQSNPNGFFWQKNIHKNHLYRVKEVIFFKKFLDVAIQFSSKFEFFEEKTISFTKEYAYSNINYFI